MILKRRKRRRQKRLRLKLHSNKLSQLKLRQVARKTTTSCLRKDLRVKKLLELLRSRRLLRH